MGWSLRRLLIRLFATEAQKERFARDLPPPHSNIFLRDDGFFYTTTIYETTNQIKRLSPVGVNVYPAGFYGERVRQGWQWVMPRFIDLTVNQYGVISALDSSSSKVYQYDQDGNLLLVFGNKGEGKGFVSNAASIDVDSNGLYISLTKIGPVSRSSDLRSLRILYIWQLSCITKAAMREAIPCSR